MMLSQRSIGWDGLEASALVQRKTKPSVGENKGENGEKRRTARDPNARTTLTEDQRGGVERVVKNE